MSSTSRYLCANSSQAKGRVERANQTLQDRLIKDLRLAEVSDMDGGNAFLAGFMERHNAKFARIPARPDDLHRPVNLASDRLKDILCKREQRYITAQLTISFERKRIMLEENDVTRGLVGRHVETYAYADGRLDVRWKGHSLPYRVFDKDQRVTHAAITENKRLSDVLAYIKERQDQLSTPKVKTNSEKNGYTPRGRKSGRRRDSMNDPAVIARRRRRSLASMPRSDACHRQAVHPPRSVLATRTSRSDRGWSSCRMAAQSDSPTLHKSGQFNLAATVMCSRVGSRMKCDLQ